MLTWIVGMGELKQIAFIEEIGLHMLVINEHAERATLKRGNRVDTIGLADLVDGLLRDHAAIADDDQLFDAKALPQPLHFRQNVSQSLLMPHARKRRPVSRADR
jgi:hypothetical protein